jgi:hypothetical protein
MVVFFFICRMTITVYFLVVQMHVVISVKVCRLMKRICRGFFYCCLRWDVSAFLYISIFFFGVPLLHHAFWWLLLLHVWTYLHLACQCVSQARTRFPTPHVLVFLCSIVWGKKRWSFFFYICRMTITVYFLCITVLWGAKVTFILTIQFYLYTFLYIQVV